MSKFTPGPWHYKPESQTRFDSFTGEKSETTQHWIRDINNSVICLCAQPFTTKQDAALIACAPEMLDFLEMVERDCDGIEVNFTQEEFLQLKALIKRARGES